MLSNFLRSILAQVTVAALALPPMRVMAADTASIIQRETARSQIPIVDNSAVQRPGLPDTGTEAEASEWGDWGDLGDLGDQVLMKRADVFKHFSAFADISAFYTGNVALTRRDAEPDGYLVAQAGASWRERLGSDGMIDFGVQEALFRYDKFREFDFDSLNLGAGVSWTLRRLWDAQLFVRYNYNRINSGSYYDEKLYDAHSIRIGLQKVWALSRADYLLAGVTVEAGFSDPASLKRNEYAAYLGYGIQLTRSVAADLLYRAALLDYTDTDRLDLSQTVAIGVHYRPIEPVQLNLNASAGFNRSDRTVFDYDVLNVGGGASLNIEF